MPGWDLALLETGDGGDFTVNGNDLAVFYQDENEIYLRLFGGNKEADSKKNRRSGDQDLSYWANGILFNHDPAICFNSLTERTLDRTPITSQGIGTIENAIKKDLQGLPVIISVQMISDDRLRVTMKHTVTEKTVTFALVRNTSTRDFDLRDFHPNDFF
jgi:hypothetical protein